MTRYNQLVILPLGLNEEFCGSDSLLLEFTGYRQKTYTSLLPVRLNDEFHGKGSLLLEFLANTDHEVFCVVDVTIETGVPADGS